MTNYTVQPGMSLWDAVLNATGSLANLDAVCAANGYDSWTPYLSPGTVVIIPDTVTNDLNALDQLTDYPSVNAITVGIINAANAVFNVINSFWILTTGYWNDEALWMDNKTWID